MSVARFHVVLGFVHKKGDAESDANESAGGYPGQNGEGVGMDCLA
ncbi:hypothetical protein [Mycobacteroides salmoniphilum]|nr:hypothetical protein [Mycobacteroides salmoniphilum]